MLPSNWSTIYVYMGVVVVYGVLFLSKIKKVGRVGSISICALCFDEHQNILAEYNCKEYNDFLRKQCKISHQKEKRKDIQGSLYS